MVSILMLKSCGNNIFKQLEFIFQILFGKWSISLRMSSEFIKRTINSLLKMFAQSHCFRSVVKNFNVFNTIICTIICISGKVLSILKDFLVSGSQ